MVRLRRSELDGSPLVSELEPHPASKAMEAMTAMVKRAVVLELSMLVPERKA
jgi:hypothetical protein